MSAWDSAKPPVGLVGQSKYLPLSILSLIAALMVAGCTAPRGAVGHDSGGPQQGDPAKPAALNLQPAADAESVAPGEPVTATVADGTMTSVTLVGADQTVVNGEIQPDGRGWRSAEPLGYGKTYTLTANAKGADGTDTSATSTFTTVDPRRKTAVSVNVGDGETVGAGFPVSFSFAKNIPDKEAAERALRITTEPQTEGAFHWFSDKSVMWRPKEYWKPGTNVSVDAAIYGKDLGNGTFGEEDRSASFSIGDKLTAVADGTDLQMKVSVNDQEVKSMPISMGKKSNPTPSGAYTMMSEHSPYTMDSGTYGVPSDTPGGYRTTVQYAGRMSNSGIFYHSAPWSVGAQGKRNTSHGCINLSTENARWMMDMSKKGDIITVTNSGGDELEPTDGWSVWQMSWEEWKTGGKKK